MAWRDVPPRMERPLKRKILKLGGTSLQELGGTSLQELGGTSLQELGGMSLQELGGTSLQGLERRPSKIGEMSKKRYLQAWRDVPPSLEGLTINVF